MNAALPDALTRLRDDLTAVRLSLELDGAPDARRARDDTVAQVDDYLLPRLRQMDAPVLMVVGGSTGAGKSTILNSLVGTEVSPPVFFGRRLVRRCSPAILTTCAGSRTSGSCPSSRERPEPRVRRRER